MPKKSTYDIVLSLLKTNERYRNSDRQLRWKIWANQGHAVKHPDLGWLITFESEKKAVDPETIRRSRQEVQEKFPELQATDPKVRKARGQKEKLQGAFIHEEIEIDELIEYVENYGGKG